MSDLTDYLKIRRQNRVLYTITGLLLIIFMVCMTIRGCNRSATRLAEATRLQAQTDSLQQALTESKDRIGVLRTNYLREMAIASTRQVIAGRRTDSVSKLLSGTQARVKRLLNERVQTWEGPMVGVPTDCDTCFELLKTLDLQVTTTTENFNELNRILNYEIGIRDTALEVERLYSDSLLAIAKSLGNIADTAIGIIKPRNKIYFTLTALTDLTGVGYGGGFTLVTKKDKVWSAKIGVLNKQLFYQADFGWLLSLRKK